MSKLKIDKGLSFSFRAFNLLLWAYPSDFRREYGPHMAQVFRDCYRAQAARRRPTAILRLWMETLIDLVLTAPKERLENFTKGANIMRAIRNLIFAIVIYAVVLIVTGKLLVSLRPSLPLAVGSFIDAMVSIGILFNFIVLLLFFTKLMKATKAVITSAIATVIIIGGALSVFAMALPEARPQPVTVLMFVLSFLIWLALHWLWAQRRIPVQPAT